LVFAAGFGNLRLAAAGTAYQFGHGAHELACLDSFCQARRDSGDEGYLSFGLRGGEDDYAFAELLLEIVYQGAKLAAFQRVGAEGYEADALYFDGSGQGFVQRAGGGLHARFFELAAKALELFFLGGQPGAKRV
jgi:hypothetical protein